MRIFEEHISLKIDADAIRKRGGKVNLDIIRNTTDADIERQKIEDDFPQPHELGEVRFNGRILVELRAKLGLSQEAFSERFGLSLRTVQQWEQGRRSPDGPASLLIFMIAKEPEVVERVAAMMPFRKRRSKGAEA
jgi:DNA-binding transcriptional regulator YiaG